MPVAPSPRRCPGREPAWLAATSCLFLSLDSIRDVAARMVRCSGASDEVRCYRRMRVMAPKGVVIDPDYAWTCDPCRGGQKPYVPRSSERKGQQKQAAARKKK